MKIIPRTIFLILLLVGALIYRFPVQIQHFFIEAKSSISGSATDGDKAVKSTSTPVSDAGFQKSNIVVVKLKNGGEIQGVIVDKVDEETVIDVGGGTVGIANRDIESIRSASGYEQDQLVEEWQGLEEKAPGGDVTEIRYWDSSRITAKVIVNDKVKTKLIMDTGAPYMVISPKIANQLSDMNNMISKDVQMQWMDGSPTSGKLILLDSVSINNVTVKNVQAVVAAIPILKDEADGLLGMSFLNKFRVNMDTARKTVVLEKK